VDKALRIGRLSEITGVSPDLLRAWERRYGLLQPARTRGGFRLYGEDDADRVREMGRLMAGGLGAAEAARRVLGAGSPSTALPAGALPLERDRAAVRQALLSLDDATAQAALDDALAKFELETVMADILIPVLRSIGDGWAEGSVSVAEEHFAVNVLRGRLVTLARGWDRGLGPRALLACPPDELHDVSLVIFGLALRRRGWRITFLGANTPLASFGDAGEAVGPALAVLYSPEWRRHQHLEPELASLARRLPLALAAETAAGVAQASGARLIEGDPVVAAEALTREQATARP
jgi:DNA-binding transcriptional MerR regulator